MWHMCRSIRGGPPSLTCAPRLLSLYLGCEVCDSMLCEKQYTLRCPSAIVAHMRCVCVCGSVLSIKQYVLRFPTAIVAHMLNHAPEQILWTCVPRLAVRHCVEKQCTRFLAIARHTLSISYACRQSSSCGSSYCQLSTDFVRLQI